MNRLHLPHHKALAGLVVGLLLFWSTVPALARWQQLAPAAPVEAFRPGAFVPGRVVVTWRDPAAAAAKALAKHHLSVAQDLTELNASVIEVPPGDELAIAAQLQADPLVASAEPDYLAFADSLPIAAPGVQPDDPYWGRQWAPRRLQTPLAWELTSGQLGVLVAMIDSGIDLNHPEFAGRIVAGYDYVNSDPVPQDDNGHGTHIAGLVAAAGNNGLGVAGTAWGVRLLVYKALNSQGTGSATAIAQAVNDAVNRGAGIITLSLSLSASSTVLQNALQSAYAAGAVIVASSGNQSGAVTFPAAYPEVIAVGATTHWDDWAGYSNYGPPLDVAAPGGVSTDQILSTGLNGSYTSLYGTSMAAPYVAGVAALMRSVAPQLSNSTVAGILRNTADKVGTFPYSGGRNDYLGYGRVNAAKAVRQALSPQLTFTPAQVTLLAQAGGPLPEATVVIGNPSSQPLSWQLVEISQDWLDVDPPWSGTVSYPATAPLHLRVNSPQPLGLQIASVRLRATSLGGQSVDYLLSVRINVSDALFETYLPVVQSDFATSAWVDMSVGSVTVLLSDDGAQGVGLPFTFPFYDKRYNQLWINANGFLSFERPYDGSQFAASHCIPNAQLPNGAIYALWDDLDPSSGGQVAYMATDEGEFVVEWRDVPRRGAAEPNTFQVVLRPDGSVLLQYRAVAAPASATVGLENWDYTLAWQEACHGSGSMPAAGQAWLFETALP